MDDVTKMEAIAKCVMYLREHYDTMDNEMKTAIDRLPGALISVLLYKPNLSEAAGLTALSCFFENS